MPKKASTRKNPQQAVAEAEPAAAEAEPAAEEPELAPALANVQFTRLAADVLVRILAAAESQKVGLEDLGDQNKTLLGRVAALEVKEAAAPAVAEPEPEPAPALALAPEPAPEPLPRDAQPDPVLQILLQRLDQLEKKLEKKSESEDPDDDLDYVPYHEGRGLNPFPVRSNGVTDKPELYRLNGSNYEVYEYLWKKKNARYHEIGTSACALSYFWDALHFFKAWKEDFKACGVQDADIAVDALLNSFEGIYGLFNRRKNLLELRATCESGSPTLKPTDYQVKLFAYLSKQLDGFENNHGLTASVDPVFKAYIQKFEADASSAHFKELAKQAGSFEAGGTKSRVKKPTPKKSQGDGSGAGGGGGD